MWRLLSTGQCTRLRWPLRLLTSADAPYCRLQDDNGTGGLLDTLGPSCYFAELALLPVPATHGLSKQVRHSKLYASAGSACCCLTGAAMSHLPQAVSSSSLPSFLAPFDPFTCNHQVTKELRDDLLAGNRWRAPFTATALSSCELYLLHAEDFQRVSRFTSQCVCMS